MIAPRLRTLLSLIVLCGCAATTLASSGQAMLDAIVDRQIQRVAILLDQGVSPETTSAAGEHEGKTALMWAAEAGEPQIIGLLLQYGAAVDRSNPRGGTALMYAAVAGRNDAIRTLVAAGADPNHRVRHGWTPLLLATVKGHVASVRLLAALGADLGTRDLYGWTLLMHATERNDRAMVEALLELGLDPADGDANGLTPITLAQRNGNAPLAALLSGARSPH